MESMVNKKMEIFPENPKKSFTNDDLYFKESYLYHNYKREFLNNLQELSNQYNLGDVEFKREYDCGVPEDLFVIHVPKNMSWEESTKNFEKIINEMWRYSKTNKNRESLFLNSNIICEY